MNQYDLSVNGNTVTVNADPDMPLLWVLHDRLGLTGTKYSCGGGYCGACTVLVDKVPTRSCVTPIKQIGAAAITTIEGIKSGDTLHPVQQAWIEERVSQCGYCQTGQIMSAIALLTATDDPSDDDINKAMRGNLCRCGSYPRIRKAIHRAAEHKREMEAERNRRE